MLHPWDDAAELRKRQIESGLDLTFSKVFLPFYMRAVSALAPSSILEVGGGTGHMAFALAPLTKTYVLLEPSPGMFAVARDVLSASRVELRQTTIEDAMDVGSYDLVLTHMCAQVVDNLARFLKAIADRLSPSGVFLLSLPHPVFYNDYKEFFTRESFRYIKEQSRNISFSITLDPDQPIVNVPYHHRPLATYVSNIASANLAISFMREVYPSEEIQSLYGMGWRDPRYVVFGGAKTSNDKVGALATLPSL